MGPRTDRRAFLTGTAGVAVLGLSGCAAAGGQGGDLGAGSSPPAPTRADDPSRSPELTFPPSMLFGVATSAYQIEGSVHADGRGQSIWDSFCERPGAIDDDTSGAEACDHYRRWDSDVELMAQLKMQTYRFSIAWPRIIPTGTGRVNQKGLDFYRRLVDRLNEKGISSLATLFHWDLPQALQDRGGWTNRDSTQWFADYAEKVFAGIDGVARWLTINEAKVVAQQGHLYGTMAPGLKSEEAAGEAIHHLGLAHGLAVQAFRASGRSGGIGPCLTLSPCYPSTDSDAALGHARAGDLWANALYLEPILEGRYPELPPQVQPRVMAAIKRATRANDLRVIAQPVDFIGVNYYTPSIFDDEGKPATLYPRSAAGWQQIYPEGLYDVLIRLHRAYGKDMVITENGMPDPAPDTGTDDEARIEFLRATLVTLHRAMENGARVVGYHAWSLLDNFEWARGYTERWGLVHVDFDTQKRTPKKSAKWFSGVAMERTVSAR